MAENISYNVPPPPKPTARDEWEELLETLHQSGTLRVLNGFFGQFAAISDVVLDQTNSRPGKNIIGSAAALGDLAGSIPAEKLQPLVLSVQEGLRRAHETLYTDPPSTGQLLKLLHDKNTRRTMAAALEVLRTVGEEIQRRPGEKEED